MITQLSVVLRHYFSIFQWKGKEKVKNTELDFTVPTGGADLCFLALQPGSVTGGGNHPVLSLTISVYLPQISPGTHFKLGWLWLSLVSHATEPRPELNNWVY